MTDELADESLSWNALLARLSEEKKTIKLLLAKNYTVEVVDPYALDFNSKYSVYAKTSIGNKVAIVDKKGKIIGVQG